MHLLEKIYMIKKSFVRWYKKYFTLDGQYTSILPDKIYLKKLYFQRTGKKLNLRNPKTFSEKGNWLKLYDRRPEYTIMVDKYKVRDFIAEKIGDEYLVPLLGVWDSPDEIDFDALPNQFVLKCNHDNGVIICKDKNTLDIAKVKEELTQRLNRDYYKKLREWPYKNVPRKIICEKFMEPSDNNISLDYKFLCFNGKVELIAIFSGRFTDSLKEDYYTADWKYVRVTENDVNGDVYSKPENFKEMIAIAEKLSKGIPSLRVDFNIWKDMMSVGELTFFHHGSVLPYLEEWEIKMGNWLELPKKRRR